MRALVTGSAGFVGRHMVKELEPRGYEVLGLDTAPPIGKPAQHLFSRDNTGSPVFDLVVHCAYHVGGRAAIDGTNLNFAKNLQLDAAMFEWAVRTKQKRVLYFSSSAAYPVGHQAPAYVEYLAEIFTKPGQLHRELRLSEGRYQPLYAANADANYGYAKVVGEKLAEDARKNGLEVTVVRPFSGYGSDQSLDYPFPSILRRASQGDLTVWGPKGQTRDWIHISDVVGGALAVVESGTTDPVNLCTGIGTEMGELAQMVFDASCDATGGCGWPHEEVQPTYLEDKPTGVFYRVGDPTRMLQYYTPKISLEEGIKMGLDDYTWG